MALSGSVSVTVTKYDTLKFSWSATQSIQDNTSTISWNMTLTATGSGYINSTKNKNWQVVVNGNTYSGTNKVGIENNSTKTLASGTTVVPHGSDGTKTFSYSFTQQFAITFSGNYIESKSGSGSATLDAIPRQVNITSAPNFTDEDNPTVAYSNPAGSSVTSAGICITLNGDTDDISYRDISLTDTSYTFELTDAERELLRNATTTSNTRSIGFCIRSVVGENVLYSKMYKTLTIINCKPDIVATVVDTNDTSIGLTGDSNVLVRTFSNALCSMTSTAKKGATILSQSIKNGDKTISGSSGTFTSVENPDFIFSVTDSRGNVTNLTVTNSFINYIPLTCTMSVTTPNGEGEATLTVRGNCFNGSFGEITNLLAVNYRIKENEGPYGEWVSTTPSVSGNAYLATVSLTGLNYQNSLTFQAMATDSFSQILSPTKTVKAVPLFDWGVNDFRFNIPFSAPEGTITNLYDNSGTLIRNGLALYESSGIDANTTLDHLILTHVNTPNSVHMYVKTEFYGSKSITSNRMQTAFYYNQLGNPFFRYYYDGSWSNWIQYACNRVERTQSLTMNSGWEAYNTSESLAPIISRIGATVYLEGLLKNTKTVTLDATGAIVATIPSWAYPKRDVFVLNNGSSANVFWLRVYASNGQIQICRYRTTNSTEYSSQAAGKQFPITASWIAADAY